MGRARREYDDMIRNYFKPQLLSSDQLKKRRYLIILMMFGMMIVVLLVVAAINAIINIPPTRIFLNYTPSSATVTVNDVEVYESVLDLPPGDYEIEVKKYGFETYKTRVTLDRFETKTVFAILDSAMPYTEGWYERNPNDGAVADGEASHGYDDAVTEMVREYPIVEKLPVKRPAFSIYYGVCGDGSCEIVIESEQMRYNDALQYFYNNLDMDLGKYHFTVINYGNQFQGERNGFGC